MSSETVVSAPLWAVYSAFRYALPRSSYIVGDTIALVRAAAPALRARGWATQIAGEIFDHVDVAAHVHHREAWLQLADELRNAGDLTAAPAPAPDAITRLELDEQEAVDVFHAIATAVQLIEQVDPPDDAPLNRAAGPRLMAVGRRLDHERRHRGAVANPSGPGEPS